MTQEQAQIVATMRYPELWKKYHETPYWGRVETLWKKHRNLPDVIPNVQPIKVLEPVEPEPIEPEDDTHIPIILNHDLPNTPTFSAIEAARKFRELFDHGPYKTREQKVIEFLADGQPHHSSELCEVIGWDWTTPVSKVHREMHHLVKYRAGKFKWYQMKKL